VPLAPRSSALPSDANAGEFLALLPPDGEKEGSAISDLRIESLVVPCAELGPTNPLPQLVGPGVAFEAGPGVPDEIVKNARYGGVPGSLPYLFQDGFGRERPDRALKVAVLENDVLRATFLLEYGGRLWSLVHRPTGRELLYRNPVLQPVNIGLRGAWFSGGVEWSIGTIGHCPLTCESLHAARVEGPDGAPILRLYEWERLRGTPFQIDAYLPDGSPVLYLSVRIRNPHDTETPMYWWSNIAVSERDDVRVVAPTESAYLADAAHVLRQVPFPIQNGVDVSYPTAILGGSASDFFDVQSKRRPWFAAVGGDGRGLVQFSTDRLQGRKRFAWGMSPGGRWWQDFLSEPGHPYLEIQAGLAKTQAEHLPMPAGASWSWAEAYGLLEVDPGPVHGSWESARRVVEEAVANLDSTTTVEAVLATLGAFADHPPVEALHSGSGWGALERRRRASVGEPSADSAGLPFGDDTLGPEQAPWLALLDEGRLPPSDPSLPPINYMVDAQWRKLLEASPESWLMQLHLGVMQFHSGDHTAARAAWTRSLELAVNPWALRNLAAVDRLEGEHGRAAERLLTALELAPGLRPLVVETVRTLIEAGRPADGLSVIDALDPDLRANGRVRIVEASAALKAGDLDRAERILADDLVVPDFGGHSRGDEIWPDRLWYELYERRLAEAEGVPINDELRLRVRREYPVPTIYDHRDHRDPTALNLRRGLSG